MSKVKKGSNEIQSSMSIKDWIVTFLITFIPVVGFIMLFVWAFDDKTNEIKANWAKASLIWVGILIGVYILFFILFGMVLLGSIGASAGAAGAAM